MKNYPNLYIDGQWASPAIDRDVNLIDPTREEAFARVAIGGPEDAQRAVAAAKEAFRTFSTTTPSERIELIDRIIAAYETHINEFSELIAHEVGIPVSSRAQVEGPIGHMKVAQEILGAYDFETKMGSAVVRREPIGVCALISPWNWPIQTIVIKLIYALAAGCTVIAKPSINSAASGALLAQVLDEAEVPAGVVNLVNGRGSDVGDALTRHPDVAMISFTGSTTAGQKVAEAAAGTIKRLCLELGGKSASLVLPDADLDKAARWTVQRAFFNSGQSCHAPTRLLVHEDQKEQIESILADEAQSFVLGDPLEPTTTMGPIVSKDQYASIRDYIQSGIDEGARLVTGGLARPDETDHGYFIQPTVFSDVTPQMRIAREEIFGPVLSVISYRDTDTALEIANDSPYGLGAYVFGTDAERARSVANGLRAGRVSYNGAPTDSYAPMGGYKESGVGRSMGRFGFEEYLELKSVYGFDDQIDN